ISMKPRTSMAVFVDLVGKIFALRHRESLTREEIGFASEQANAIHTVTLRLGQQLFHQPSTTALALSPGSDRDRSNLGQVRAIEMQRATADDAPVIFEHHEVSDVLANLRQSARQQRAVAGISRNQVVDLLCVGQNRFTRAHGPPGEESRFSYARC